MEAWTKDGSKFNQMASEASTALALWKNIGHLVGIDNFPKDTKCLLCDNKAKSAEHLVNKAHGGNHTKYNVIPVCDSHKKPGKAIYKTNWQLYYKEHLETIYKHVGTDDSLRLNPHHEQNITDANEIKSIVKETVLFSFPYPKKLKPLSKNISSTSS